MRTCRLLAAATTLLLPALAFPPRRTSTFRWAKTEALISFGDSYTYTQGTLGYPGYSSIGDALNLDFTAEELLGNRIVQNQTGTAEGGPNWVEFITDCAVSPGLTDPRTCKKQLWNFSFAGSGISSEYIPLHHDWTTSFVNQTKQFVQYGEPVLSEFLDKSKTLVGIWIGINDISDSVKYPVNFYDFYNDLHDAMFEQVEIIYGLGYNNFLFLNLPPLDRTPSNAAKSPGAVLPNATMIDTWNDALRNHSVAFAEKHLEVKSMVFDVNTLLNNVLDNYQNYGFKNITGYCAAYNQPNVTTDPGQYGCLPLDEYLQVYNQQSLRTLHFDRQLTQSQLVQLGSYD